MSADLAPELEGTIKRIVAKDKRHVLFDLGALEYLRTSTLRVILKAVKQINPKNGKMPLPQDIAKALMKFVGVASACIPLLL
jgi:anti-anti-sigma factor